jgi:cytochrome P450
VSDSGDFDIAAINRAHGAAEAYCRWREGGDAVTTKAHGGYHAVLGYEAVRACASDGARLISGEGITIPAILGSVRAIPAEMDPPAHAKYRKLVQQPLRPARIEPWSARIAEVTDQVIDEFIEAGKADLHRIAQAVPPVIIAEVLGCPDEAQNMTDMTDVLLDASNSSDPAVKMAAIGAFAGYVDGLVSRCEQEPDRDDLLAQIVHGSVDDSPLPHETAVGMTVTLVLAGQETTVNGIGSMLWLLGAHPEVKERLIADPGLIPQAVEEVLRLEAPVSMLGRIAAEDLQIDGVRISKGEMVGLVYGAANLDPAVFPDPGAFDIDREAAPHLTFGFGAHRCVGEHLARAEMRIVAERVLARIPDYRLTEPVQLGVNTVFSRGPVAVPATFTPRPAGSRGGGQRAT